MDDPIRDLLSQLPPAGMIPTPPGTVAILRRRIEESDEDLGDVERWIHDHAGELRVWPSIRSGGLRPGRVIARDSGPTPYYVIPTNVLAA